MVRRFDLTEQKFDCSGISSGVGEIRETKKNKATHGFHKAGVYCANFYSDPVVGHVGVNALVGSEFNSNKA